MAVKVTMPKLSDTMTEGVIVKWIKKEGDNIEAGDVIAEAESDKATMELEAFDAGILKKIIVKEGGKVPVNGTIAVIAESDEDISGLLKELKSAPQKPHVEEVSTKEVESTTIASAPVVDNTPQDEILTRDSIRIKASPLARKMAAEKNLDMRKISGSGPGGRIIKRDVETVLAESGVKPSLKPSGPAVIPAGGEDVPLSTMRESIAKTMVLSKQTTPHFYLTTEIDMDKVVETRLAINAIQSGIKISYNDIIVKAVAVTLKKHPRVNGSFAGDKLVLHGRVDIGIAVALDDGLITPVIRNCETKSLGQIAIEIRESAKKAKDRKLKPDEYTNATFNISNLGMYDIDQFTAIITPPQAAVLAVGVVQKKPVVKDDEIVIGHRVRVTLSCDHRIVDGATGALFLKDLKKLLENPLGLML
ncbi:pyruvate dehydrogenase complex dihydrolipoamide acetyltransferase [candidate division KSB1 bacterium]|nr:pyruvate dehydrogenase complex dihydrolipoamide acetyltransferase [candidate division KSB1 bacterium]